MKNIIFILVIIAILTALYGADRVLTEMDALVKNRDVWLFAGFMAFMGIVLWVDQKVVK